MEESSMTLTETTAELTQLPPTPEDAVEAPEIPDQVPETKSSALHKLLGDTPSNVDSFLAHLQRCLSTPSGIDTVLLFVCYSTRLSSAVLTSLVQPALHRSAKRLIALASALPPAATLLITTKTLPSNGVALILELAKRLKAVSAIASEARTITRLWGLLGMYFWARRLVHKARSDKKEQQDDKFETSLAWSQLIACVIFQALENGAYLTSKGVLAWKPSTTAKAARWSARFWGSFIGLELIRLVYEHSKRGRRTRAEKFANGKTVAVFEREEREWSENWRRSVVRNLAWAPLTLHWSLEKGLIPEMAVGALACIPSVVQIRQLWRSTAE